MSLEDQYDAWVRGLMGGGKYAATPKQAEDANDAVQQMQAQLDALTEAQKRQTAAGSALNAVQKAGAATAESVRRMSSELTKSLKQDGLLGGTVAAPSPAPAVPVKADFAGVTEKIKAQVLGQDAFVSALVKAFRRPFVLGTADDTAHARSVMLLCGPNGTGRHYALQCVVDELAARGVLHSAAVETLDLALYPGPAQEKLFLQDLYAALQSAAEVLTFEHYESCAANYLNMLATLAMDGTLALSSRYVLQRGILVDVGTALAPGAIGELQAGGKYFVFYSNKGEAALAEIRAELKSQGYLKYYKAKDKKQKPADFLRYTSSDGFEILVGRNNAQNDKLTLHTARGKDLWFHVQKAPGSHVVVMSRGEDIPDTTKQEAAELAVIHSSAYKAGTGAKVAVDTTEVKNIWKANGAKPGMVLYEVYTTVYITPRDGLEEQLKQNIAKVKQDGAQLIVVIFHWGNEKEEVPDENQKTLGHLAIDEGADLVCGHHPHVLQGIEEYKGKNIVYSLGNFCFGGNAYPSDMDTIIFQQTFTIDQNGVKDDNVTNIIPCSISSDSDYNNYQPTPAEGEEATRIMQKIQKRSSWIKDGTVSDSETATESDEEYDENSDAFTDSDDTEDPEA